MFRRIQKHRSGYSDTRNGWKKKKVHGGTNRMFKKKLVEYFSDESFQYDYYCSIKENWSFKVLVNISKAS